MEKKATKRTEVNPENVEAIKRNLDWALGDCKKAPSEIIVKIVMYTLDNAQREGRLNAKERKEACDYLKKEYGYDF